MLVNREFGELVRKA